MKSFTSVWVGNKELEAFGFDLGGTLVHYRDTPLNWCSLYAHALTEMAAACGRAPTETDIATATAILTKYNTRVHPRLREVRSDEIMEQILAAWRLSLDVYMANATRAFFEFFQQRAVLYEDVIPALRQIKSLGLKVGILTDVPYGMDRAFIERDMAGIAGFVDTLVTSVDAGWRKPESAGFDLLAGRLGVSAERVAYVGDEEKDVVGARSSGMWSVLLDRENTRHDWGQDSTIADLTSQPAEWMKD